MQNGDGSFTRLSGFTNNRIRGDWLFSYQPTPGTVFFLGYGSSLNETDPLRFKRLTRVQDGLFVKYSVSLPVVGNGGRVRRCSPCF